MEKNLQTSIFKGIDFSCKVSLEICTLCANQCDLRVYTVGNKKTAWGLKCGREYDAKTAGTRDSRSRLEKKFKDCFVVPDVMNKKAVTLSIPQTLFMAEYASLFKDFFQELGLKVVIENSSSKKLAQGMNLVNADFCAPMALTHGLVESLFKKEVDYIFLPTLINGQSYVKNLDREELFQGKSSDAYFCYYSSYAATIVSNLPGQEFGNRLIQPTLRFNNTPMEQVAETLAQDLSHALGLHLDLSIEEISQAFLGAQKRYEDKKQIWASQGASILKNNADKIKILLLGRPYALFDPRINQLHKTLFEVSGFESHVMPLDREMLNQGYRYATGGECLPNVAIVGSLIACLENKQIPPEKAVLYLPGICMSCNFNQYADLDKLACQKAGLGEVRVMNQNGLMPVPGIPARSNAQLLSITIFETLPCSAERKPRIGLLGDLYAKFNEVLNESICDYAQALGGAVEQPLDECLALMEDFGFKNFIAGETAVSIGRMLYYIKHNLVQAVIHVNPVFSKPIA